MRTANQLSVKLMAISFCLIINFGNSPSYDAASADPIVRLGQTADSPSTVIQMGDITYKMPVNYTNTRSNSTQ